MVEATLDVTQMFGRSTPCNQQLFYAVAHSLRHSWAFSAHATTQSLNPAVPAYENINDEQPEEPAIHACKI